MNKGTRVEAVGQAPGLRSLPQPFRSGASASFQGEAAALLEPMNSACGGSSRSTIRMSSRKLIGKTQSASFPQASTDPVPLGEPIIGGVMCQKESFAVDW